MSYIRSTSVYKYVDEKNPGDYVFCSECEGEKYIEDYGNISPQTLLELIGKYATFMDSRAPEFSELFKELIMKRLAEHLGVKLRKKPLTTDEEFKLWCKENKVMTNGKKHDKIPSKEGSK